MVDDDTALPDVFLSQTLRRTDMFIDGLTIAGIFTVAVMVALVITIYRRYHR